MRLLVLSFYFRPDLSAGSFRATSLVAELSRQAEAGDEISVLTTQPNRYRSFDVEAEDEEQVGNVCIRRMPVPQHSSGMLDQARSYVAFAGSVLRDVWNHDRGYDVVFATSARLGTGALGAAVARRVGAPLYLDVRDLFLLNLSDMFARTPQRIVVPLLRNVERWTIGTASRVSVVSPGFLTYLRSLRRDLEYRVYTNGIDEEFLGVDFRSRRSSADEASVVLYAGNVGEGQGLEHVVPEAASRLAPGVEFWVVGDGGRRRALKERLRHAGEGTVRLLDPVPRKRLIELYRRADVLFLHLNDYEAFRRVLPSKVFEYAATGKPLLAGVEGVAREFIEEHVSNSSVFPPCDVDSLIRALDKLEMATRPRRSFVERFKRSSITRQMASDIRSLASSSRSGPSPDGT